MLCVDARATPAHAREWLDALREVTDKPVEWLVLTHYHAVRTLGASAFAARWTVAHGNTHRWIAERGEADWESEYRRFPRLFRDAGSIPGLTRPTFVVGDLTRLWLGEREVQLVWLGGAHTTGDLAVWLPGERVLFSGDLVEAQAAPYMGDASIAAWPATLERVEALDPDVLVPGRGPARRGGEVGETLGEMRAYLELLWRTVRDGRTRGLGLKDCFEAARGELEPRFGDWAIFEHCLPFNVKRAYDEAGGLPPQVWTAELDADVWADLQRA